MAQVRAAVMLLLPGTWHCSAQLQGEPQLQLKWELHLQSSQPELLFPVQPHRPSPLPVPPVPCQLSSARFQFLGSTTPCPVQLCWFHCYAVPCKHHLISCGVISQAALWELILGSSFAPDKETLLSQAALHLSQLSDLCRFPGQSLLTNCNKHQHSLTLTESGSCSSFS